MWRTGILVQTKNSLRNITERCVCIKDIRCRRERSWWPGECFHIESNRVQLFSSLAFLPLTGREGPKHWMYFVEDSFPPPGRKGLQGRQRWWRVHQPAWEQRYWAAWEKAGRQNPNAQGSSNIYTAHSDTLRGLRPAGLSLWDLMLGLHRSNSFHPLAGFIWDLVLSQPWSTRDPFHCPSRKERGWHGPLPWPVFVGKCPQGANGCLIALISPRGVLRCFLAGVRYVWM